MRFFLTLLGAAGLISSSYAQVSSIDAATQSDSSSFLESEIEERAKAIVYVPAQRPQPDFQIQEKRVFEKSGHTITYNRVSPPPVAEDEVVYKNPSPVVIPDFFFETQKEYLHFHFFGTVINKQVTEITWYDSGEKVVVLVNADLSFLHSMGSFETEDKRYTIFGFLGLGPASDEIEELLAQDPFVEGVPIQYVVLSPKNISEEMLSNDNFKALDSLLSHYESNKASIWQSFISAQARGKAYREHKEANPPSPDVQINFWKIEQ